MSLTSPLILIARLPGRAYCRIIARREFNRQKVKIRERFIEYGFTFRHLNEICPETLLDVGPGASSFPHLVSLNGVKVTAIDKNPGLSIGGMFNRHFYVQQQDITSTKMEGQFDCVTCISVLEHIHDAAAAFRNIVRLAKPGGHILISFPYNEKKYVENAYKLKDATFGQDVNYICRIFSRSELDRWISENQVKIVEQEYWRLFTGEFLHIGEQVLPPEKTGPDGPHHLTCLYLRKDS